MERTKCNLCGSSSSRWKNLFIKHKYIFVRCEECGFVFTSQIPEPDELKSAYCKDYYSGLIYKNYTERMFERRKGYVSFLMHFQSLINKKNGKILEIGCATGDFLDAARFLGYETYGIEISEWAANESKIKGHKIQNINVDEIEKSEFKEIEFDYIFLWDVFEHLAYPDSIIKKLVPLLKIDGVLVLNTLNIASPTVKLIGKRWSHYYPPYHLSYFGLKTLRNLLSQNSLNVINVRTEGKLFYDDYINKYYLLTWIFNKRIVHRISNVLKLGYSQTVIARKIE
jgi:2-polyprenyl-3-methyl-5-hydroxy-6-metoxy-1,4-benzoquinol methylase